MLTTMEIPPAGDLSYDFSKEATDPNEEDVGLQELIVADYVVFLFALDTYMRYLQESGDPNPEESSTLKKGMFLLKAAERMHLDAIKTFIQSNLVSKASISLLEAAMRPPPTPQGASLRALKLRTVLSKGGTATTKAVFGTSTKARREVTEAIEASMIEDADAALNKFSALVLRNKRLEAWIDEASEVVVPGTAVINPIQEATKGATEATSKLLGDRVAQDAGNLASEAAVAASEARAEQLEAVQVAATETAKKAIAKSGAEDAPITRSEAIGVAASVAAAVTSDPDNPQNVPAPLRKLDDEQRAAALTDGRVLVAAGAGAGKSTTLVSRVEYLVKERRVNPSRILVTSFNTKAANELKHKIGKAIGNDAFQQMSVGTMHSLFRRFIGEYGTRDEKIAMGLDDKGPNGMVGNGAAVAGAVTRAWAQCFAGTKDADPPKTKDAMRYKSQWSGNNITPDQAKAQATTADEMKAAIWYEFYEGFKGTIPGWKPPCSKGTPKEWETFMAKKRPGGIRLGDFDDMLSIFRDILKRNPAVRAKLQSVYDHLMVDECQDLNEVQNDIVMMMSEQVTDGADGKSLWMVGDDKQAIYGFRGARPDLFTQLDGKEGWKTRMIKTNYRCEPEIVEAANKLISNNTGQIPMEARPAPTKPRGMGTIAVKTPTDEAAAALSVVEKIKSEIASQAGDVSDNAVLSRTNRELHAYETACIIRGVPYARKGSSSFLGSPETKTFLSYVQLITGDDGKKMQEALKEVINRPNRFFVSPDRAAEAVENALSRFAMQSGLDRKVLNPVVAMESPAFRRLLAEGLVGNSQGFKFDKAREALSDLSMRLTELRAASSTGEIDTKGIFDEILNFSGKAGVTDPRTGETRFVEQSFREALRQSLREATGGDDDDAEEDEDDGGDPAMKGLGNIAFLYELAKPDPTEPEDQINSPTTPLGFKSKMERMVTKMRDLRIDLDKWDKEQAALPPEQRKAPPGVYLGTCHSTKGAQWKNVYVQMPKGKFPFEKKPKPGEPPPDPVEAEAEMQSERRLAYVAITRPIKNLTVICPSVVGGKPAGVSPFVTEAGLRPGENVTPTGETPTEPKMASSEYEGLIPDEWAAPDPPAVGYDFSGGVS